MTVCKHYKGRIANIPFVANCKFRSVLKIRWWLVRVRSLGNEFRGINCLTIHGINFCGSHKVTNFNISCLQECLVKNTLQLGRLKSESTLPPANYMVHPVLLKGIISPPPQVPLACFLAKLPRNCEQISCLSNWVLAQWPWKITCIIKNSWKIKFLRIPFWHALT